MKLWQNFIRPKTIKEALHALGDSPAPACVIAGGTDLILDLQLGNHPPVHTLVDVTSIPAFRMLEVRRDRLFIGAAVPISRIVESPLVNEHAQALVEACRLIAGPQVRNVATLGGNAAHALPAADGTIALKCLDVQAEVVDSSGSRLVPFSDLFRGPGESALKSGKEILAGFYIPLRKVGQACAFRRVMRAQGIALPILNLSVWLECNGGIIRRARIAPGPAGPTPRRAISAEEALCGHPLDDERIEASLEALLEEIPFRTSPRRATANYRRHLVGVLLKEVLGCAWERAAESSAA